VWYFLLNFHLFLYHYLIFPVFGGFHLRERVFFSVNLPFPIQGLHKKSIFTPFPSLGRSFLCIFCLSQCWDCIKKHFLPFPKFGTIIFIHFSSFPMLGLHKKPFFTLSQVWDDYIYAFFVFPNVGTA